MKKFAFILALAVLAASSSFADNMPVNADGLTWGAAPPVLPKGAQTAVLSGDPSKDGLYVLRLKMPANYKVPAHNHPTSEYVTVISGNFHIGMGDKLDEKNGVELRAGGFGEAPTVPPGLDSAVLHRFARVLRRLCACASRFAARVEAVCRRPCCPCCQW